MDGIELVKDLYKVCPVRLKFIPEVIDFKEGMDQEIWVTGKTKTGIPAHHIYDLEFECYFSFTGLDRIKITENAKVVWGNYNLIAKYLNKGIKSESQGWLAVYNYLTHERKKFAKLDNQFFELKKDRVIDNYIDSVMKKLDGYGLTQEYKESFHMYVKPKDNDRNKK